MQMFGITGGGLAVTQKMQNGGKRARRSVDQWDRQSRSFRARSDSVLCAAQETDCQAIEDTDDEMRAVMERDKRLTGFLRGQSDNVEAPPGFEVSNPWRVCTCAVCLIRQPADPPRSSRSASCRWAGQFTSARHNTAQYDFPTMFPAQWVRCIYLIDASSPCVPNGCEHSRPRHALKPHIGNYGTTQLTVWSDGFRQEDSRINHEVDARLNLYYLSRAVFNASAGVLVGRRPTRICVCCATIWLRVVATTAVKTDDSIVARLATTQSRHPVNASTTPLKVTGTEWPRPSGGRVVCAASLAQSCAFQLPDPTFFPRSKETHHPSPSLHHLSCQNLLDLMRRGIAVWENPPLRFGHASTAASFRKLP